MSRSLSSIQADELHKSIIGYAVVQSLPTTASALRTELGLGDDVFSSATAYKYGQLLQKKWATVSRLETKLALLEAQNTELESQLKCAVPAASKQDPNSWIPAPQPKFVLESHSASVNCLAFHPVFSSLASGSDDCTIKIWDWELGEIERTIKAHTQAVRDVDFGGPKGAVMLASCSSDRAIKLWDPSDGYKNIRTLNGHEHAVTSVRFLPWNRSSKNMLVSASADRTIRVWDVTTGYCARTLQRHSDWVRSVCPSDDGRFVLSSSSDKTALVWDVESHNIEPTQILVGHDNAVECCAVACTSSWQYLSSLAGVPLSTTAAFFATGSRDRTIKLWNATGECFATLVGHDSWVSALLFHPGGKYIFSVADDKTIRIWDLKQRGQCVKVFRHAHDGFITCLRWALATNPSIHVQNGDGHNAQFRCVMATGSMDKRVKIFADK